MQLSLVLACLMVSLTALGQDYDTGVSTEALSLPSGPSSIEGMPATINESNSKGQFGYKVEIKVPKGINGHTPKIDLEYNSQNGLGPYGLGWKVNLPVIERSSKKGVPTYAESDIFWGPDGELVKIDKVGSGTQFYAPYIVKDQNFYELNSTDMTWVLHRQDGSKITYGEEINTSGITHENGVFRWYPEKHVDAFGNQILFHYEKFLEQPYLTTVSYAFVDETPHYEVSFIYEESPAIEGYKSSEKVTLSKRCESIMVKSSGEHIIRQYDLQYRSDSVFLNNFLEVILQKGVDGEHAASAMPPLKFSYHNFDHSMNISSKKMGFLDSQHFPPSLNKRRATLVDINRDSFPDILETSRKGARVWINNRDDGFAASYHRPDFISVLGEGPTKLLDVDGDRVVDFLSTGINPQFNKGGFIGEDGNIGFNPSPVPVSAIPNYSIEAPNVRTLDLNGDGRLDILAREVDGFKSFTSSQSGSWDKAKDFRLSTAAFDLSSPYSFNGDMNGDGLVDLVFVREKAVVYLPNKGSGVFDNPVVMSIPDDSLILKLFKVNQSNFIGDVNNDGLADLVSVNAGTVALALNRGSNQLQGGTLVNDVHEDELSLKGLHITTADINGNGSMDIVWTNDFHDYRYLDFNETLWGALNKIENGLGLAVEVEYVLASKFSDTEEAEPTLLPSPMWVVGKIVEKQAPDYQVIKEENFKYFGGFYHQAENDFRGFSVLERLEIGDSSSGTLKTRSVFEQGRHEEKDHQQLLAKKIERFDHASGELLSGEAMSLLSLSTFSGLGPKSPAIPYAAERIFTEGDVDAETVSRSHKVTREIVLSEDGVIQKDIKSTYLDLITLVRKEEVVLAIENFDSVIFLGKACERNVYDASDALIWSEHYRYDGQAHCEALKGSLTQKLSWNGSSFTTKQSFSYTAFGALETFTDSLFHTSTIAYDALRLFPLSLTNSAGHIKSAAYDVANDVMNSSTDENGLVTAYSYDPYLRLLKIIGPADSETYPTLELVYEFGDEAGIPSSLLSKTRERSGIPGTLDTKSYYDAKGRQVAKVSEGSSGRYVLERTTYSKRGEKYQEFQKSFQSDFSFPTSMAAVRSKQYHQDALKRPILEFNPEHTPLNPSYKEFFHLVGETIAYDEERKVSYEYKDALGRRVGMKDALEHEIAYSFDPLDQLLTITDPQGTVTLFGYDLEKRRTCKLDPNLGLTTYSYNSENLVTEKLMYGHVVGHSDCNSPAGVTPRSISYEYADSLNRITKVDFPSGSATNDVNLSYDSVMVTYGIGKKTGVAFGAGSKVLEYDIYGNLKKSVLTIGSNTYTTEWLYNALGTIEKIIYPTIGANALTVRNEYDEAGQLAAVKDDSTGSPFASGMEWSPLGQLQVTEFGNNTKTTLSYDEVEQSWRLNGILTEKVGTPNTTLQEISYTYDKVSNVSEREDVKNSFTESYQYDDLHRLVSANLGGVAKSWSMDEIGNITSNNGTSYSYDVNRKQVLAAVGSDAYAFDAFGNITSDADRAFSFNWDNRLSSVTKSTVTTSYDYDEDGIRIKKTTPSKVTEYIEKYTEVDGSDVIRHIFAGKTRIASIDGLANITYNHEDHLGSSNLRTNASGNVVKTIEYMPFGEKRSQSGSYDIIKNRYTGQYEDEESDLYYYQQRYYDPVLSKFISADPLYSEEMDKRGTDSQELNLYAYAKNNPVKYVDSNGEAAHLPYTMGIGAVIGGASAYITASQSGQGGWDLARSTFIGAATGAASGALPNKSVFSAMGGMASNIAAQLGSGKSIGEINAASVFISGGAGLLGAGIGNAAGKYLQVQPGVIGNTLPNLQGSKFSENIIGNIFGGASSSLIDMKGQEFNDAFGASSTEQTQTADPSSSDAMGGGNSVTPDPINVDY